MKSICVYIAFLLFFCAFSLTAQQYYAIKGVVRDATSGEILPYASVSVWNNTSLATVADSTGQFVLSPVPPGSYRVQTSYVGYKPYVSAEFRVSNKDQYLAVEMENAGQNLSEVVVVATPFRKTAESPLGMRVIGFREIEKSAGGNRDISRVVQSFPGVASTAAFRNDLMVRGGGPSENRFFLDGVEIPNINHFSTQGASGGPVGIINPDFIREVNFYAAAFPAAKGNALSSVLDFKLQDGNREKTTVRGVVGASEVGLSANGPLGKKTTYQVSVRRSYLQFLFDMIGLPFLPTFTDGQFKLKTRFDSKNELTVLGLGAIDDMKLNTGKEDMSEKNKYILDYLPVVQQQTYTLGAVYKHYSARNVYTLIMSRSFMNNRNTKYLDNDESQQENLTLRYRSNEEENQLRSENTFLLPFVRLNAGANMTYAAYTNRTYQKVFTDTPFTRQYETNLGVWKWGMYVTAQYETDGEGFSASFGLRADANNYSGRMDNLLKQLSPRLSASLRVREGWYLNANVGRYYELPPYTALGLKDNKGKYANKQNLCYIRSDQAGLGVEYRPKTHLKFTMEGFYKHYDRYPFSLTDSVALASKGTDYGVFGNEEVSSTASGRAYGFEWMGRWYNYKGLTFIASYTYVRSEFKDVRNPGRYLPTAWDNKHLFTFSGTYALPRNWDIGTKLRVVGGAPYTPYDLEKSSLVEAWNANGQLYYDYARFNSGRLPAFTQLDIRVDKTFYFKKLMLGVYIDIQNILNSKYKEPDVYIRTGKVTESPQGARYELKPISRTSGTLLPSIGIMIEI